MESYSEFGELIADTVWDSDPVNLKESLMGLDQYAFSAPEELTVEQDDDGRMSIKGVHGEEFQWRKHAKLQEFFEHKIMTGELSPLVDDEFNCNPVKLTMPIINELEGLVQSRQLPRSGGGFFYGHQFQDESDDEYLEQDLKFCSWAKQTIEEGDHVYYDCWW